MIEVFQQIEEGRLHLTDSYVWKKKPPFAIPTAEYEENVGILDFLHEGLQLTLEDLLYLMIVISDNSAFNILLTKVGMENVNSTMKKLGLVHTSVGCLLFEWDERRPEKDNYHSVREIGSLLKRLYRKQLVSTSASEKMLRLMTYHQRREKYFLSGQQQNLRSPSDGFRPSLPSRSGHCTLRASLSPMHERE